MKKVLVIVLVSFVLISSVFTAGTEKTGEATLVLNFDEQKFLVGFSKSNTSIDPFDHNEILLKATNAENLKTFSLGFESAVYLYYQAVTNPTNTFNVHLSIMDPLRLDGTSTSETIGYTLTATPISGKWEGTNVGVGASVSSPTTYDSNAGKYASSSVNIGNIRDSSNNNYYVSGFAQLSITSTGKSTEIPYGTYRSTVQVSIVSE